MQINLISKQCSNNKAVINNAPILRPCTPKPTRHIFMYRTHCKYFVHFFLATKKKLIYYGKRFLSEYFNFDSYIF